MKRGLKLLIAVLVVSLGVIGILALNSVLQTPSVGSLNTLQLTDTGSSKGAYDAPEVEVNELPEKYEQYVNAIAIYNSLLSSNPAWQEAVASVDEGGVNITADDVKLNIEFTEDGLVKSINVGTRSKYETIGIDGNLDEFLLNIDTAETTSDYWNIVTQLDLPFEFYLIAPGLIASL